MVKYVECGAYQNGMQKRVANRVVIGLVRGLEDDNMVHTRINMRTNGGREFGHASDHAEGLTRDRSAVRSTRMGRAAKIMSIVPTGVFTSCVLSDRLTHQMSALRGPTPSVISAMQRRTKRRKARISGAYVQSSWMRTAAPPNRSLMSG
ncbi:MAG: hypothetical protein AAF590_05120 [Pseudomonadota bacterium]